MKATNADQRLLLEVADIDHRLAQSNAQRKNPPQAERIAELTAVRRTQTQELMSRSGVRDDLRTEIARIESDVVTVRGRLKRDEDRLSGASAKDAVALESEIESLRRRLSDLEDSELESMERLETADAAVAEQEGLIQATNAEGASLSGEAKQLVADATALSEGLVRDRAVVADLVPADLLAMFERLARNQPGAGLFRHGMCEGCRVLLSGTDLAVVRAAADDEVLFCPSCGCILVRTEESGL